MRSEITVTGYSSEMNGLNPDGSGDASSLGSKRRTQWMGVGDVQALWDRRLSFSLFGQQQPFPCALPCRARHDNRNTTRPEQCVLLFWGPSFNAWHDLIRPLISAPLGHVRYHSLHRHNTHWIFLNSIYFRCLWSTADHTHRHADTDWQNPCHFGPLTCSHVWSCSECSVLLWLFSSVQFVQGCALPLLRALYYDSGMYATTCDVSFMLWGPSAWGETQGAGLAHQRLDAWLH